MRENSEIEFIEQKKRQIIESYNECMRQQKELRDRTQTIKAKLDITATIQKEKSQRRCNGNPVVFNGAGCEIDDYVFIEQIKDSLARELVDVVKEEVSLKNSEGKSSNSAEECG